jgi:hypothetical protein
MAWYTFSVLKVLLLSDISYNFEMNDSYFHQAEQVCPNSYSVILGLIQNLSGHSM